MGVRVEGVPPLGRGLREYELMFALGREDRQKRILACADGAAGFNAEWTAAGGRVVSVDPVYAEPVAEIRRRVEQAVTGIMKQVEERPQDFAWEMYGSPEVLKRARLGALETFAKDFEAGLRKRRYVAGSLPALPFEDGEFDVALCSHFLFLYSGRPEFGREFHLRAVAELCRVAPDMRLFPLLTLDHEESPFVADVTRWAESRGYRWQRLVTPYELQKGGNECLRITRARG